MVNPKKVVLLFYLYCFVLSNTSKRQIVAKKTELKFQICKTCFSRQNLSAIVVYIDNKLKFKNYQSGNFEYWLHDSNEVTKASVIL